MLTFLTMAIAQKLDRYTRKYVLIRVDVHNPVYSVLFALLVGLAFMMIVYILAGLFGNVGKGIAIIILVLSISGGGGNYPIQVSGKFFQFINPLLPFTHAVNLLRESAGGILLAKRHSSVDYFVTVVYCIWHHRNMGLSLSNRCN